MICFWCVLKPEANASGFNRSYYNSWPSSRPPTLSTGWSSVAWYLHLVRRNFESSLSLFWGSANLINFIHCRIRLLSCNQIISSDFRISNGCRIVLYESVDGWFADKHPFKCLIHLHLRGFRKCAKRFVYTHIRALKPVIRIQFVST